MKAPDLFGMVSGFFDTVEKHAEDYYIYCIIAVVGIIGFIIYSVVT